MAHYTLRSQNVYDPDDLGEDIADVDAPSPDEPLQSITPRDPDNQFHMDAANDIRAYAQRTPNLPAAMAVHGYGQLVAEPAAGEFTDLDLKH